MVGEWSWPEEAGETRLAPTNNILGHVLERLRNIVQAPVMEPATPSFPHFILKVCVLGKFCSGKTTCLAKIAEGMQSNKDMHIQIECHTLLISLVFIDTIHHKKGMSLDDLLSLCVIFCFSPRHLCLIS